MVISLYNRARQTGGAESFRQIDEFQLAIYKLGGQITILSPNQIALGERGDYNLNIHFYFNPAHITLAGTEFSGMHIAFPESKTEFRNTIATLVTELVEDFYKTLYTHFISVDTTDGNISELKYA